MLTARTIVGLSGGVDSAVAAALLQRSGATVAGLYMQNWDDDGDCRGAEDRRDALKVAAKLGMPFYPRNFAQDYRQQVFAHFLAEYRAGRTPNPDVLCNREIKFKVFLEHALALGAECIATGHYARIAQRGTHHLLLKGRDPDKDQSYFLCLLDQYQLAHARFPLGDLTKTEVRSLAAEAGLAVHAKPDSTGICFVGERDFAPFLAQWIAPQPGEIHTPAGELIGRHNGVSFHTIGQRGGLGIGGRREGSGEPWFVVGKDMSRNLLIVDQGSDSPHLQSTRLRTEAFHWIAGGAPAARFAAHGKVRYRQSDQACEVVVQDDQRIEVRFAAPQRAVTPGQQLVLYLDDLCLGGGVIATTDASFGGLA